MYVHTTRLWVNGVEWLIRTHYILPTWVPLSVEDKCYPSGYSLFLLEIDNARAVEVVETMRRSCAC